MSDEVKSVVEDLKKTFETGRGEIDAKMNEVGKESSQVKEMVAKVSADLVELSSKHDELKKAVNRPNVNAHPESKSEGDQRVEQFLRKGRVDNFDIDAKAAAADGKGYDIKNIYVGNDPAAGFAVRPSFEGMYDATITEISPFRQNANVISLGTGDAVEYLVNQKGGVGADWEDETSTNSDTGNPTLSKKRIGTAHLRASVYVSEQQLQDSFINIEQWIMNEAAEDFATTENDAFFNGDGINGKPKGFLTYAAGTSYGQIEQVSSGAAAGFTTDGILALVGSQKFAYNAGSIFYAKRETIFTDLLTLKDAEDRYYLVPDWSQGVTFRMLGYPVIDATDMPAVAANALALAFGNFNRGYTIVDRVGMSVLRDPYSNKPFVEFWIRKRVGGDVRTFEAIKIQKLEV
jgi:HK97 family phage major capsid protein